MKIIYIDMDGVIADFNRRYIELFNHEPGEKRDEKFGERWRTLIDDEHFASFDWMSEAQSLLYYLKSLDIQKAILSSTGGFNDHNSISKQKQKWLTDRSINYPAIFVPGKQYKPGYANKNSLLIDDTLSIITAFQKAGGAAVHHTNANETIQFVESWLND